MNILTQLTTWADSVQQRHKPLAFLYAVVKKYGDDNGGYQAALLTYYGFVSLFPLLLVFVTIMHFILDNNADLQAQILDNLQTYFPLLGDQLTTSIGSIGKTGFGLAAALLFTFYGARGGADAMRFSLDTMWHIPKTERLGFPKNILRSVSLIAIAALGFLVTAGASVITSGLGEALWVKILVNILGFAILSSAIVGVFRMGISKKTAIQRLLPGAIVAGACIQMLLTFGGILVAAQLQNLDNLYGTFAIVLGLLFWIYLLSQVLVYAAEINTVRAYKLWPRGLDANQPTKADKAAQKLAREV